MFSVRISALRRVVATAHTFPVHLSHMADIRAQQSQGKSVVLPGGRRQIRCGAIVITELYYLVQMADTHQSQIATLNRMCAMK